MIGHFLLSQPCEPRLKTVLTWMLSSIGAPGALLSMLVPVRESGSMLPQVFVSGYLARQPRKMPFYRAVIVLRSAMLLSMTLVAALVPAESRWLPALVLATLALYSLGSSSESRSSTFARITSRPKWANTGWKRVKTGSIYGAETSTVGMSVLKLF